ncbi:hypothetical protein K438DRAFT_1955218 [Mycena galopus ATCC 62051]|nr:hypothetical protein K438DRAFT_1955218 [Mycena galopus ATCC 62051]
MADTEVDNVLRTFDMPAQNATKDKLLKALKDTQLKLAQAEVELHAKDQLIAELQNSSKKSKGVEANPGNYLDIIISLGKKFGVMQEPWISPALFAEHLEEVPHATPDEVDTMFKDPKPYLQYLTNMLYEHVPDKHHDLVSGFPRFQENFTRHLSVGRSTVINTLKTHLDNILGMNSVAKDYKALLYHPDQDWTRPPSSYPPIFYGGLKKDVRTLMTNPVGPMSLRCMIFAASSMKNGGKAKLAPNTMGYMWKLDHEGLTFGSIAFTLVVLLFLLSGADEDFQEKGKISKIPFQAYFRAYKCRLMKNADSVGVRKIKHFWMKIVFAAASAMEDEGVPSDGGAESDEFAATMDAMSLGEEDEDEDSGEFARQDAVAIRLPVNTPVIPVQANSAAHIIDDENMIAQGDVPDDTVVVKVNKVSGVPQAVHAGGVAFRPFIAMRKKQRFSPAVVVVVVEFIVHHLIAQEVRRFQNPEMKL